MLQNAIVFVIVAGAALYALWRWLPQRWRRGAARRLAGRAHSAGLIDARRADQLSGALGQSTACGACSRCGGCKDRQAP